MQLIDKNISRPIMEPQNKNDDSPIASVYGTQRQWTLVRFLKWA